MPSRLHELLVDLFRTRPALVGELLGGGLGVAVPDHDEARVVEAGFTALVPTEYNADASIVLYAPEPVLGVVVEVQLSADPAKLWSWPHHAATLRARIHAPAAVLVVTPTQAVAEWAGQPIETGPNGSWFQPLVAGPAVIPVITDPAEARRSPELALLSACAHGRGERGLDVARAVIAGAVDLDTDRAAVYTDVAYAALDNAARAALEALMDVDKWQWQSPFAKKYVAIGKVEGKAEGKAEALLAVLATRGLEVEARDRARIEACADAAVLDRWIERAVEARSTADVFA